MTKVHPLEGVTTEVSFISDIKGIERFPSGKNIASGTMTKYPHGIIDAVWHGSISNKNRKYRSFEEARAVIHGLSLKSRKDWKQYCKSSHSSFSQASSFCVVI